MGVRISWNLPAAARSSSRTQGREGGGVGVRGACDLGIPKGSEEPRKPNVLVPLPNHLALPTKSWNPS